MQQFPIGQLQRMKPSWAMLEAAEMLAIPAGSAPLHVRRDSTDYLLVLEGAIAVAADSVTLALGEGEMTIVRAGIPHTIGPATEDTVLLRLSEPLLPPFRESVPAEAPPPVLLPPGEPLPPSRARAIRVAIEADATFSPRSISGRPDCDVVLAANPGALSLGQAREYQAVLRQNGQCTAVLQLDLFEREIALFFHDRTMAAHTDLIAPRAIALAAELTTAEGRKLFTFALREWARSLHTSGIRLVAHMPLRAWPERELRDLFAFLAVQSPGRVGLMLRWDPIGLPADHRTRATVIALLPWLHAVEITGEAHPAEIAHFFESIGFQGWVVAPWNRDINPHQGS